MDLKETYNRIAEDWDKDHATDDWWVAGVDAFTSRLPAGASILDAGCGGGTKSKFLAEKRFAVTGIDFSEKMVAIAQRKVPGVTFRVVDLYDLSALTAQFDGIFLQAVLLHFPKKDAGTIVRGLTATLKPGGYFYIAVKEMRTGQPDEEIVKENDYGYEYERPFTYFNVAEIKKYCEEAGLKVVYESVSGKGRTQWIQVIAENGLLSQS